jgi:hypothetical protein
MSNLLVYTVVALLAVSNLLIFMWSAFLLSLFRGEAMSQCVISMMLSWIVICCSLPLF